MATLFEMIPEAQALYELLQNDEIDEETFNDTLAAIGVDHKLESYCQLIKQYEADAAMYKAEADRLSARKKTAENNAERMKAAVMMYMQATNSEKAKAGTFAVSMASSQAVQINDAAAIPPQYFVSQEPKVDKTMIRDAIKKGELVPGAELVTRQSVRIR